MTSGQPTKATDVELTKACGNRTFQIVKAVSPHALTKYLGHDGNFPMIGNAIAQAKTNKDKNAIVETLKSIGTAVISSNEDHMKHLILECLHGADPGLFFDFCRAPQLSLENAAQTLSKIQTSLNRTFPGRKEVVKQVSNYVVRRLIGDHTARTPLLYGPPGGGKSELATQLAKALTAAGIAATPIFQVMSQESAPQTHNDVGMRLLGSSKHYANGTPGDLYHLVSKPEVGVGLVLLDEADKSPHRDYMIGLLDPKTPLQDQFMREVIHSVDLRRKSLMLLTANDPKKLNQGESDPLWSRLEPVHLPSYTQQEMIGLAVDVICGSTESPYQPTRQAVRKLARETVHELGAKTSFRVVLDRINDKIYHATLGIEYQAKPLIQEPVPGQRRTIGFRGSYIGRPLKAVIRG